MTRSATLRILEGTTRKLVTMASAPAKIGDSTRLSASAASARHHNLVRWRRIHRLEVGGTKAHVGQTSIGMKDNGGCQLGVERLGRKSPSQSPSPVLFLPGGLNCLLPVFANGGPLTSASSMDVEQSAALLGKLKPIFIHYPEPKCHLPSAGPISMSQDSSDCCCRHNAYPKAALEAILLHVEPGWGQRYIMNGIELPLRRRRCLDRRAAGHPLRFLVNLSKRL
jgi:hypothetical protein